jgi:hypothetical protein
MGSNDRLAAEWTKEPVRLLPSDGCSGVGIEAAVVPIRKKLTADQSKC